MQAMSAVHRFPLLTRTVRLPIDPPPPPPPPKVALPTKTHAQELCALFPASASKSGPRHEDGTLMARRALLTFTLTWAFTSILCGLQRLLLLLLHAPHFRLVACSTPLYLCARGLFVLCRPHTSDVLQHSALCFCTLYLSTSAVYIYTNTGVYMGDMGDSVWHM